MTIFAYLFVVLILPATLAPVALVFIDAVAGILGPKCEPKYEPRRRSRSNS